MKVPCALASMLFVLPLATASAAQISIYSAPINAFTACINDAIQSNGVKKSGTNIVFTCDGLVAQRFYETLGHYGKATTTHEYPSGGTWLLRYTNNPHTSDFCGQRVQDANGQADMAFGCSLYFPAGDFINE